MSKVKKLGREAFLEICRDDRFPVIFLGLPIKECRIHAVGHRRDADAEKNIREGLPLVPLRLVDGCDPVKSRAAGGGPRPLPHAAHR